MGYRGLAAVLCAAMLGCASRAGHSPEDEGLVEETIPLDLSVDRVDVAHGALRVGAKMHEGSSDVSVSLDEGCEHREVGGGIATPSTLMWTFAADEVADAIGCGLLVVARARTPAGPVLKVASLAVVAQVAPSEAEPKWTNAGKLHESAQDYAAKRSEETPELRGLSRSATEIQLLFAHPRPGERLSVGDSLVEPSPTSMDGTGAARFTVPLPDFARAILSHRPLRLGTSSLDASLGVGGVAVDADGLDPPEEPSPSPPDDSTDRDENTTPTATSTDR
jgi:hypothetical protein